ncbi:MAG: alpha/beta hydrolase [Nevskiaceae bacterium]|nr:MAG: alpha/beta hydrolase [Nevskiaceae bacterium]
MTDLRSRSDFLTVRGLRYHIRRWGAPQAPAIFIGHGWLDVSATFDYVARALLPQFQVLAPDWRGFGHSQWPQDGYWFHDYVADLEAILDHYAPDAPALLAGHSMGAQIMSLYAGLRPQRVRKLVCMDGLFLPDMDADSAPRRFRRWLDELKAPERQKVYTSYEELAARVRKQHPQLSEERALFVARCWGFQDGRGRITLCADPKHRLDMPSLYRAAESMAVWKQITAPTLFIDAGKSAFVNALPAAQTEARRACFATRETVIVADAGHMLHFDAPEETARHIARFFAA